MMKYRLFRKKGHEWIKKQFLALCLPYDLILIFTHSNPWPSESFPENITSHFSYHIGSPIIGVYSHSNQSGSKLAGWYGNPKVV